MSPGPSADPAARVLVADGDPATREVLAAFLILEGYAVSLAPDGHRALERAVERPPDLVLADAGLPGIAGPELRARLRGRGFPGPVVLMAADPRLAAAPAARPAPVVRKPLDLDALLATIRRALAGAGDADGRPSARASTAYARLAALPDAALAEAAAAAARRLWEPGLGRAEMARLLLERVLAEALLRERQGRRRRRDDPAPVARDGAPCPRCRGSGRRGDGSPCAPCGGRGRV